MTAQRQWHMQSQPLTPTHPRSRCAPHFVECAAKIQLKKSVEQGVLFLSEFQDNNQSSQTEALEAFCLLALNLNAFIYID